MPMFDVYSAEGTFKDKHMLAADLAAAVMRWEKVPDIALFRNNTAALSMSCRPTRSPSADIVAAARRELARR
jgi:hypothetical protein